MLNHLRQPPGVDIMMELRSLLTPIQDVSPPALGHHLVERSYDRISTARLGVGVIIVCRIEFLKKKILLSFTLKKFMQIYTPNTTLILKILFLIINQKVYCRTHSDFKTIKKCYQQMLSNILS